MGLIVDAADKEEVESLLQAEAKRLRGSPPNRLQVLSFELMVEVGQYLAAKDHLPLRLTGHAGLQFSDIALSDDAAAEILQTGLRPYFGVPYRKRGATVEPGGSMSREGNGLLFTSLARVRRLDFAHAVAHVTSLLQVLAAARPGLHLAVKLPPSSWALRPRPGFQAPQWLDATQGIFTSAASITFYRQSHQKSADRKSHQELVDITTSFSFFGGLNLLSSCRHLALSFQGASSASGQRLLEQAPWLESLILFERDLDPGRRASSTTSRQQADLILALPELSLRLLELCKRPNFQRLDLLASQSFATCLEKRGLLSFRVGVRASLTQGEGRATVRFFVACAADQAESHISQNFPAFRQEGVWMAALLGVPCAVSRVSWTDAAACVQDQAAVFARQNGPNLEIHHHD